ncbi:MAG TPA: hypothetical protein VEO19_00440 [Terriglobia bacterium]|nr:hypothetical protein [Terriglobia bacterium]
MVKVRAGFVSFGIFDYPRDIMERKCERAIESLRSAGLEVISTGLVTDKRELGEAQQAFAKLCQADLDVLIACVAGWIPSQVVVEVVSEFRHLPMVLWGLSGKEEGGRLVTTAEQAGTTALRRSMEDLGFNFRYVPNFQDATPPLDKIVTFARAAAAARQLRHATIGEMGYRDMNLYATMFDGVSLRKQLGIEVEFFEMLEMVQRAERQASGDVSSVVDTMREKWAFETPISLEILEKVAKYYLAVGQKARERNYQAISLIDVDGMRKLLNLQPAMILMLLADELGLCTIPENDTPGAVSQLITHCLTGQIGAYLEFYEFFSDRVLMGVPDYVPSEVVDGPVRVKPASFGGIEGAVNTSRMKTGLVTLCRMAGRGDHYLMHLATGDAATPRAWEEAGWAPPAPQLPGLEIRLHSDMNEFAQNVLGQHYILSYGDNTAHFKDFCRLLQMDFVG